MKQPSLISVIIPAYNGEKYIAAAIESVLSQTDTHYEIIVVDNGSTDRTQAIVTSYTSVAYHAITESNTALARNYGLTVAQGEWIAFLDQDDRWVPEKLEKQRFFLEASPLYDAVIGLQQLYLEENCHSPAWLKPTFLEKPQMGYLPSALLFRREVLKKIGDFNVNYPLTSDADWFFRAKHQGIQVGVIDAVLVYRRIHEDNAPQKAAQLNRELLRIVRHSLKQRRMHE